MTAIADSWTIAGFDPSGGAGISADQHIFEISGLRSCALITALTVQNEHTVDYVMAVDVSLLTAQLQALKILGWPKVIKVGLIPSAAMMRCLRGLLSDFPGTVVYDPVMIASSGKRLMDKDALSTLIEYWLPRVDVITPNVEEASILTGMSIQSTMDMQKAAYKLCKLYHMQVVIKGGHLEDSYAQDIWCNGIEHGWLTLPRLPAVSLHGSGCIFSSALASGLVNESTILDAFVYAKMVTHSALKERHHLMKRLYADVIPWLTTSAQQAKKRLDFAPLKNPLGFYTIINELSWFSKLHDWGVKTVQLRLKERSAQSSFEKVQFAVKIFNQHEQQLFINDDWGSAIATNAYGIHLGQEDLKNCDLSAIHAANLRLGISTHSLSELARAKALRPSYIAFGPIYPTKTKSMTFNPQGLEKLKKWRRMVSEPLVAIGGINLKNIEGILACKVDSVAVISAVTKAADSALACRQFLSYFQES